MYPDWESALQRAKSPYHEWAIRRAGVKGMASTRVVLLNRGLEADITSEVLTGRKISQAESYYTFAKQDPELAAAQLAEEINDDPISFDAAKFFVAGLIRKGVPVPLPIREWAAMVLTDEVRRPKAKGKLEGATIARDKLILRLILDVMEAFNLKPTASDRRNGRSACHAVASGLGLLGVTPSSYESILGVWEARDSLKGFDSRED